MPSKIIKRPFYEVIIERLELKLKWALLDSGTQKELIELGEILAMSSIPENKKGIVTRQIKALAEEFDRTSGDDRYNIEAFLHKVVEEVQK